MECIVDTATGSFDKDQKQHIPSWRMETRTWHFGISVIKTLVSSIKVVIQKQMTTLVDISMH